VSRGTWDHDPGSPSPFAYGAVTLYGPASQPVRLEEGFVTPRRVRGLARSCPATPTWQRPRAFTPRRFGLLPVRSPLLGESRLISFPRGTEMFHFPRCRTASRRRVTSTVTQVSPFGNPGIKACLRLPRAYRSLPRPSSPPAAKASTVCP